MKIGLIVECALGGPDASVYQYVASKICPNLEIEKPITSTNKKYLIEDSPQKAQILLQTGCGFVFIIWDREKGGNCQNDCEVLTNSLNGLGIDLNQIRLCCIDEMMESWMIADNRGFMSWIRNKTDHPLPEFGDKKTKAEQTFPKQRIKNYLRDNFPKWKYNHYEDNLEIVKSMPDFTRAANWNPSFAYFKQSIENICPQLT